jgi:hypothetical protein
MTLDVEVRLTDAVGAAAVGDGSWQLIVRNNGAPVHDTGSVAYTGAVLAASLPVTTWTHLKIVVTPARYAAANVELNPSTTGPYRDDTLTTVRDLGVASAKIDLPLLRVQEAVGLVPPSPPQPGKPLAGPWLKTPTGKTTAVYRELLVTSWLASRSLTTWLMDTKGGRNTGPLGDPDRPGWDRFNTRGRATDPSTAGAAMLLEYGEVGTTATGARFLVGIWAPARPSSGSVPTWRDMVAFIHPSTAKTWYPPVAYPFRPLYPYVVGDNPNVPTGDPDRTYQPYVNLGMRYLVGEWSPYHLNANEAVMVSPVFPNPVPAKPDSDEYGLPFRTPAGLARLMAEVNLYLHRIRYGFSGVTFDRWWGSRSIAPPNSTSVEVKVPPLRRIAVAAYSASTTQLDALLSGQALSNGRYPGDTWGVPGATLDQFTAAWRETWCLDLLTGSTTVRAATFEGHLDAWVRARQERRFLMGGSGTTGHDDPDKLYPTLAAASTSVSVQSTSEPRRHARLWRGPDDKWMGVFCTNAYLSASAPDPLPWPVFPVSPSDDDAHGFMFEIASGFAISWTTVGVP